VKDLRSNYIGGGALQGAVVRMKWVARPLIFRAADGEEANHALG
jgi:hypothetical protein